MLTDQEIARVASRIFRELVPSAGLHDVDVVSEDDFDGAPIIRVTARYERRPEPKGALMATVHPLRSALMEQGDDRFIILSNDVVSERTEPDLD